MRGWARPIAALLALAFLGGSLSIAEAQGFPARCSACSAVAAQLRAKLESEAPRNHLDARHRLDKDGKRYGKVIEYKLSELRMIELIDTLCDHVPDHQLAAANETAGTPQRWVKSQAPSGLASTEVKAQRKQLANYCADLLERHEDELAEALRQGDVEPAGIEALLCQKISRHCEAEGGTGNAGQADEL